MRSKQDFSGGLYLGRHPFGYGVILRRYSEVKLYVACAYTLQDLNTKSFPRLGQKLNISALPCCCEMLS